MKCMRYGYLPTRNGTRALIVKEWECSADESGKRQDEPEQALKTPYLLLLSFLQSLLPHGVNFIKGNFIEFSA